MNPDQINGCFELVAGLLLLLNVIRLHHDKQVRGVHVVPIAFMAIWGFWNLYFYPYVGALWSFVGGIVVVVVNSIWVGQMIYYRKGGPERKLWPKWSCQFSIIDKKALKEKMEKAYNYMIFQPPRKK